jgi:hypothetical protein
VTTETDLAPILPETEIAPAVELQPTTAPLLCPVCRVPLHLPTEQHEHEDE